MKDYCYENIGSILVMIPMTKQMIFSHKNLSIMDKIFPDGVGEDDVESAELVAFALRSVDAQVYEKAGFVLQKIGKQEWAEHFFNISEKINFRDNGQTHRKTKKVFFKEPSKFNRLIKDLW